MPFPWMAAAIAGSAVLGATTSGGGGSKGGPGYITYKKFLPPEVIKTYEKQLGAMPSTIPISFGGQTHTMGYGPASRAAGAFGQLARPVTTGYAPTEPSGFTGATQAMLPYLWMWAMQGGRGQQQPQLTPQTGFGSSYSVAPGMQGYNPWG